ncbi:hypothetical protein TrLO_g9676 [Triparma laevis f. longispina]|uniref:Acid phosphatase n=1 Tax=Triparma laevis f. longispina TaxID=1714387 RepID=A0A9W7CD49_9STRA|nr:hypothetical protein TrLO_g9676 [Triparma laevis f. longispina]
MSASAASGYLAPLPSNKPKLIAFDLDGTIWSPDMYMLWGGGSPFTPQSSVLLKDCSNKDVKLLGISGEILDELKGGVGGDSIVWEETKTAWVSCTDEPEWAQECMRLFKTPSGSDLKSKIDLEMIHKSNKQTHFNELKEVTGIGFEEMLFFDNERYNCDSVSKLGVKCVHCPEGMTLDIWNSGLRLFD